MEAPDRRALQLAGGMQSSVAVLPTAAAADNNHERAGRNALNWFRSLGAQQVNVIPVIDRDSANDEALATRLAGAKLVYLLGGFPYYLARVLQDSLAWRAVLEAWHSGAVLAGSSAGAMVLCESFYDPHEDRLVQGLNVLPGACVLPHHNRSGRRWAAKLLDELPGFTLIGIDEQTGMINDREEGGWSVYGAGSVTIYRDGTVDQFSHHTSPIRSEHGISDRLDELR